MAAAGYSGTPLSRKLSLKPGMTIWLKDMPDSVRAEIGDVGLREMVGIAPGMMAAHVFTAERAVMEDTLAQLRNAIASDGFVWISWPKKASKRPCDFTEDTIREIAYPMGWVDVKVCAVDATWSGLKLMIRKELR
ncbi:DUF3052 family protein [Chakrabartia godavariana]|nr:DUF3052 family protein [Chakrabartia godavariana]